jgi:uncharacterized repeat protein (TIGR03837 family)
VLFWVQAQNQDALATVSNADVWIEAFGCDVPAEFILRFQQAAGSAASMSAPQPVWINVEYLSAEAFVESSHRLPSPVMSGPAKGWTKTFFYPGFTQRTGGLLREGTVANAIASSSPSTTVEWLGSQGVPWQGERLVSLFCYEPRNLATLLDQLAHDDTPTTLLVTSGRASAAVRTHHQGDSQVGNLRLHYLPHLTQIAYDTLLQSCDLNFVRGEDSLVRAIWAGKPFVWHIYPQDDGVHMAKLDAFLDLMELPESARSFQQQWNQGHGGSPVEDATAPAKSTANAIAWPQPKAPCSAPCELPLGELVAWQQAVLALRSKLLQMDDLSTQLLSFVDKNR